MNTNLQNKVMVITGASSGIGAATAIEAAKAGMHVALAGRRLRKLNEVCEQIRSLGRTALPIQCNVNRDTDMESLIHNTMDTFGRIDVAYANAGYGYYNSVAETPDSQARRLFETNFFGTLRFIRQVVPIMKNAGRGHIIICSSAVSEIAPPMFGMYSATKAAQDSIACSMRAELAPAGIHVTSVHPIGTKTEFFDNAARLSPEKAASDHLPASFRQDVVHVAQKIVKCMSKAAPEAEIWPCPSVRFGLAIMTAFPTLSAFVMRRMHHNQRAAIDKQLTETSAHYAGMNPVPLQTMQNSSSRSPYR